MASVEDTAIPIIPQPPMGDDLPALRKWAEDVTSVLLFLNEGRLRPQHFRAPVEVNTSLSINHEFNPGDPPNGYGEWQFRYTTTLGAQLWALETLPNDTGLDQVRSFGMYNANGELIDMNFVASVADTYLDIPNKLQIDNQDNPNFGTWAFYWQEDTTLPHMRMFPQEDYTGPGGSLAEGAYATLETITVGGATNVFEFSNTGTFKVPTAPSANTDVVRLEDLDGLANMRVFGYGRTTLNNTTNPSDTVLEGGISGFSMRTSDERVTVSLSGASSASNLVVQATARSTSFFSAAFIVPVVQVQNASTIYIYCKNSNNTSFGDDVELNVTVYDAGA